MDKKPILLKNQLHKHKFQSREVVGIIGAHRGAGTTYTGLMISFYLAEELGKKTAYIECSKHNDLDSLRMAYNWEEENYDSFSYYKVTCFPNVKEQSLPFILGGDFDYYVIDFGADFPSCKNEFMRCTIRLVIGGHSEWNCRKLREFDLLIQTLQGWNSLQERKSLHGRDWCKYIIPLASTRTIQFQSKEMGCRIYSLPYEGDPTFLTKKTLHIFKELFRH